MLGKMLSRKVKKALEREGVGDLPDAVEKMIIHAEKIPAVLAYVLLSQVGLFDTAGFLWFGKRIIEKLVKSHTKGAKKNGNTGRKTKGSQSAVPGVQGGCEADGRSRNGGS
jgi:hypothetical protein